MSNAKVVLVVEDDANDARLLRVAASRTGAPPVCHFVTSGEQAVAWLDKLCCDRDHCAAALPDLILLDWRLPGLAGTDLVQWIRARAEFDGVEVIAWSGALDPTQKHKALQAGADRFVLKPALFEDLVHALSGLFADGLPSRAEVAWGTSGA
jgi:CheY-like chemotaxis protein